MKKHIIYLTTSMDMGDFKQYLNHWSVAPNPSNQNFHNKMIRALSQLYKVDVISVRPFSRSLVDLKKLDESIKEDGNITWHYIPISRSRLSKYIQCKNEITKLIKKLYTDESIIFTDTINTAIVFYLNKARKHNNYNVIGVVTDSPSNISNTKRSYTTFLLDKTRNLSGYIALTKELDELFNPYGKPSKIIEGIVEKQPLREKYNAKEDYFFFGGALLKRYGIYELVNAFNELNKDYKDIKLYIAGHHADTNKLNEITNNNPNIKYLGILGYDDVLKFESGAISNVNPRPFSEDLDRFSIPSKTLEYMVSGNPTISVKNTKLQKYFDKEIVWAKSSYQNDLKEAMEKVLTATKEIRYEIASEAKKKVLELYGFKPVANKIKELIDQLD